MWRLRFMSMRSLGWGRIIGTKADRGGDCKNVTVKGHHSIRAGWGDIRESGTLQLLKTWISSIFGANGHSQTQFMGSTIYIALIKRPLVLEQLTWIKPLCKHNFLFLGQLIRFTTLPMFNTDGQLQGRWMNQPVCDSLPGGFCAGDWKISPTQSAVCWQDSIRFYTFEFIWICFFPSGQL